MIKNHLFRLLQTMLLICLLGLFPIAVEAVATCDSPVATKLPLFIFGKKDVCRVTSGNIRSISSRNIQLVEINGQDFTNTRSRRVPAKIDGKYYIHYVSNAAWSYLWVNGRGGSAQNDAAISPTTATFDKNSANQADIQVTLTPNGNTLDAISDGSTDLVEGNDYTVADNMVTISMSYLANQPEGALNLTFDFSAGNDPVLAVTVIDTTDGDDTPSDATISPTTATFDKNSANQADIQITLTPNGNTLDAISDGSTDLVEGNDYTVADNMVTISMSYLANQPEGALNLTFDFSVGNDPVLVVTVIDTTDEDDGSGGSCNREETSCMAPTVNVTDIDVGTSVVGYGQEADTDPLPMAIAAMPSGGSRLAWLGTNNNVYVAKLDCNDQLVGTPKSFPGIDLQDIYADDEGGVVLITRNATNGGTDNCGSSTLCGGSSSQCKTMHMVRFDDSGNVVWEQQVTNLSNSLAGYDNGARFVWWYQHHGRLAYDGNGHYAAYFGTAITVNNGSCVDIHEGDRMQVVDANGSLVSGHPDSFAVGCSHSWTARMVWDPRTKHFVMVCATDNNCRIARPNPYRTVASGTCDGTLFGGDLVLASTSGYWTAWSQGGQVRLEHFTDGASDTTITPGASSSHPHLVSFGANRMLLAWESGQSMAAQILDSGTGESVGQEFTINVKDHNYQAFKAYPDGSVAYPAAGNSNTSIRIARVLPCSN